MKNEKMISVDVTREKINIVPVKDELTRDYIGGEGTGTRLLWEMVKPNTDALAPGNAILFATTPLNGTIFPAGARGTVVFKSPETGTISMSNIGGHWSARLKFAGYGLIAVTGKAKKPVYLFIDDKTVELRDAAHLWGTTIPAMEESLTREIGGRTCDVLGIGAAGERMVRLASVANNIRFAGKGGSGARPEGEKNQGRAFSRNGEKGDQEISERLVPA